jgi:small subunit ribosomal protein S20
MAHTHHAIKDIRKSKKRTAKNLVVKRDVKRTRKDARVAIAEKQDSREELLKQVLKKIDKAVQKGIIKKNTGARYKSRLMKHFNKNK